MCPTEYYPNLVYRMLSYKEGLRRVGQMPKNTSHCAYEEAKRGLL